MNFNSLTYLLFLIVVVIFYWSLPRKPKLILLFFSSLTFYGFWRIDFIPLILLSVVIDYYAAIYISKVSTKKFKKLFLYSSLITNLTILFIFKYFIFFTDTLNLFANLIGVNLDIPIIKILLPIGISFYTFQSMSYTIDVYRNKIKPNKEFLLFANYVIFFPQLVAGPILRANEVIWQLDKKPNFNFENLEEGTKKIFIGLFLKTVLSDNLAILVDDGFSVPKDFLSAIDVLTLSFSFGFQIYFDFAGYSFIAIGSALLMGIKFPENFEFPYLARSPREFWQRWHISLSSWIRDYIYYPLLSIRLNKGSTGGLLSKEQNKNYGKLSLIPTISLFFTWLLMGLWHGAAFTFIVWGLWHASLVFLWRVIKNLRKNNLNISSNIEWLITLPLIMLGWIPFRADSLNSTFTMWGYLLNFEKWTFLGLRENTYLYTFIILIFVISSKKINNFIVSLNKTKSIYYKLVNMIVWVTIFMLSLIYLEQSTQFIYFQF